MQNNNNNNNNERFICKMVFGSYLYGTNTEYSDQDFKGVYLPTLQDCVLAKIVNSKRFNTKTNPNIKNIQTDIDTEFYSLQYFLLNLGKSCDTALFDMIHCPEDKLIQTSKEWQFIQKHRSTFYTKHLKSYVGYCRSQAAKYGIKGSRLADAEQLLKLFKQLDPTAKLAAYYDDLPTGEYSKKYVIETYPNPDKRVFDFCGKKFMADAPVKHAIGTLQLFINKSGARAQQARDNLNIDWKAVSHAFRVGYQLKEIYNTGDLIFPLRDANYLKDIKQGKFHFVQDKLADSLDNLVQEIEVLAASSHFPLTVDIAFWENWLCEVYRVDKMLFL